jgi:hypothetical protein
MVAAARLRGADAVNGDRFIVTHVAGFTTAGHRGTNKKPGLSAHVLDTARNHEVVASFRSEDRGRGPGNYLGVLGALQAAEAEAKRLNEWEAGGGELESA